jgi:transcriptional regulator with XRE-family HTH domain
MIHCQMTKTVSFSEWLDQTLKDLDMKPVELARKAKIDPGVVTRILKAERSATPKTLEAISHALKLPVDLVYEKAGILPRKPELSPVKRKLAHLAQDLPDSDLEMVITMLEQRQEYYKRNPKAKPAQ